jgi:hypothetical protein
MVLAFSLLDLFVGPVSLPPFAAFITTTVFCFSCENVKQEEKQTIKKIIIFLIDLSFVMLCFVYLCKDIKKN